MDFDFVQFKLPGRWGSLFCVIRPGKQRDVVAQAVRPVGWLPKDFIANHSLSSGAILSWTGMQLWWGLNF